MIIISLSSKNTIPFFPFFSFSVFLFINIVFAIAQKNKRQTKKQAPKNLFSPEPNYLSYLKIQQSISKIKSISFIFP